MKLMKIKAPPSKKGTKPEINTKKNPKCGCISLCEAQPWDGGTKPIENIITKRKNKIKN